MKNAWWKDHGKHGKNGIETTGVGGRHAGCGGFRGVPDTF